MSVLLGQEYVYGAQIGELSRRHPHKRRSKGYRARAIRYSPCVRALSEQGELGWHLLSDSEKSDLQLGTAVGTGSYGIVREATYKGYKVAVKVLSKKRGNQAKGKVLRKLAREIDLLTRLQDCSNVVQLINVLEDDEHAYLICELCRGGDLEKMLIERGPFSERAAARVAYEAIKTVAACHEKNVIHGDVKPANFLLRQVHHDALARIEAGSLQGSWLKSIDFGCSQVVPENQRLTRRTGTPVFMAPETFQRKYGLEADLWSVGIMLYQLIACRFPFWATYEECRNKSVTEVMHFVMHGRIPLDYGPWLSVSADGIDLMRRLTQRMPSMRITAHEALEHAWFKTQLATPPPAETKLPQRSNIIPRVTKQKTVHQLVPAKKPEESLVQEPAKQGPVPQVAQDQTSSPQESDHHSSTAVWQPDYSIAFMPS